MILKITTVYEYVDQDWLKWYLQRLGDEDVLPGSTKIVSDLKLTGSAEFTSEDPSSPVTATTYYEIEP